MNLSPIRVAWRILARRRAKKAGCLLVTKEENISAGIRWREGIDRRYKAMKDRCLIVRDEMTPWEAAVEEFERMW